MLYNYIDLLLSCTCVLDSDETRLSTTNVTQQLVERNEVVRKEMIKHLSTKPTVTCRTGPKMRIQRDVTQRKNETRKSGGQKKSILSWREPRIRIEMKKNSHAVSVSRRLLLGAYRNSNVVKYQLFDKLTYIFSRTVRTVCCIKTLTPLLNIKICRFEKCIRLILATY
jgi:hypothetical protein